MYLFFLGVGGGGVSGKAVHDACGTKKHHIHDTTYHAAQHDLLNFYSFIFIHL